MTVPWSGPRPDHGTRWPQMAFASGVWLPPPWFPSEGSLGSDVGGSLVGSLVAGGGVVVTGGGVVG